MAKLFSILILLLIVVGCSSGQKAEDSSSRTRDGRPLVDDKYSIRADREALDEIRSGIPPEKKRDNDEMALLWSLMSEVKRPPQEIRSQFDSLLRKTRSRFDKDLRREREVFTKDERKKREGFLKSQQDDRKLFSHEKKSKSEKDDFFKSLDEKRSEFFSIERDRRADFESDVRERRKNFDDYIRQKQNEFNQEYRSYIKKYEESKKPQSSSGPQKRPLADSQNTEALELERALREAQSMPSNLLESGQ